MVKLTPEEVHLLIASTDLTCEILKERPQTEEIKSILKKLETLKTKLETLGS